MATRHRGKDSNVWQWLYDQGEERLTQMAEELAKNKTLTDALARALRQAAHTKGRLDKNMQNVLGLLNVPSRADYVKLLTKLEMLQGSLVNVNMKLDRILAGMAPPRKSRRAAAGKPAAEE